MSNEKYSLIRKNDAAGSIFRTILFIILAVYTLTILFLIGWGILTSFKTKDDYLSGNYLGLPKASAFGEGENIFTNYLNVFTNFKVNTFAHYYVGSIAVDKEVTQNLFDMFINSIIYAGIGAIIQAIVPAIIAYLCAKYKFKFSKWLYAGTMLVYIIPIVGNYPAMINVLRGLGLFDNFLGHFILKFNFTGMYFFVFYAFFESMSDAYTEAAEIDGASQMTILVKIILPMTVKMITTVALILFVQYWNDYQTPLLYLPTHPTLSYGVYCMENGGAMVPRAARITDIPGKMACCMILVTPILILFIAIKDKLMGNISMGGIKE